MDEGFRQQYRQRGHRMAKGAAKVAAARRLAVRLFWMLRTNTAYPEIAPHREQPAVRRGRSQATELIGRSRIQPRLDVRMENHGRDLGRIDGWRSDSLPLRMFDDAYGHPDESPCTALDKLTADEAQRERAAHAAEQASRNSFVWPSDIALGTLSDRDYTATVPLQPTLTRCAACTLVTA